MKKYLFFTGWTVLFIYLLYISLHGLFLPDEGYILHTASRILGGQTLYKDFDFVYTPFTPLLALVSFVFFGQSILGERLFSFLISATTCIFLYKLSLRILKNQILSFAMALIYASFGPGHINFIWPSIISVDLAIISLYFFIEKKWRVFGAMVALVFLTKQNLGIGYLLSILAVFILDLKLLPSFKNFTKGVLFVTGIFLAYLLMTYSLEGFLRNMYTHTFEQILVNKNLATPLLQGSSLLHISLKTLFYSFPLWLSCLAIYLSLKQNKQLLLLPFTAIAFFIFGVRPVTDYVHLMPLMALTCLPLIVLLVQRNVVRKICLLITILLIFIGLYTSLNFNYYRFKPELIRQDTFIQNPKVMIWTDKGSALEINTLNGYVNKNIGKKEKIYLNYYAPMFYFFLDRPNPTRFDYPGLPLDLEKELVGSLKKQEVDYILSSPLNQLETGLTQEFIKKNYKLKESILDYEVWKIK